jgi:hypothetical protein
VIGLGGEPEVAFPDRREDVDHGVGDRPLELAVAVEVGGQGEVRTCCWRRALSLNWIIRWASP